MIGVNAAVAVMYFSDDALQEWLVKCIFCNDAKGSLTSQAPMLLLDEYSLRNYLDLIKHWSSVLQCTVAYLQFIG